MKTLRVSPRRAPVVSAVLPLCANFIASYLAGRGHDAAGGFPDQGFEATNHWVDVSFVRSP